MHEGQEATLLAFRIFSGEHAPDRIGLTADS